MAFKMKGSPMNRNFGVGSPAKQKKTSTTVYEGRDNEKGQSQNDVINMREKKVKDYNDAVKPYLKKNGKLDLTEEQFKKYEINFNKLKNANTFSRDSIDTKNAEINLDIKNKNKKADDSGLFSQGSPNKQRETDSPTYDVNGTDERVYDVDQRAYDNWRGTEDINTGEKGNAPNVRYLGQSENKRHLEDYLKFKKTKSTKKTITKKNLIGPRNKSGGFTTIKNPGAREEGPEVTTTTYRKK